MLDGMSDSIQGSRIENLQSREVDRQSPTGLILYLEICGNADYVNINCMKLSLIGIVVSSMTWKHD